MGGASEDEGAVDLGQSADLHLGQSGRLLQPAEGLLDQPAATQADRITGMPVVLASMFERLPVSFFAMCGVTFKARAAATKSFAS